MVRIIAICGMISSFMFQSCIKDSQEVCHVNGVSSECFRYYADSLAYTQFGGTLRDTNDKRSFKYFEKNYGPELICQLTDYEKLVYYSLFESPFKVDTIDSNTFIIRLMRIKPSSSPICYKIERNYIGTFFTISESDGNGGQYPGLPSFSCTIRIPDSTGKHFEDQFNVKHVNTMKEFNRIIHRERWIIEIVKSKQYHLLKYSPTGETDSNNIIYNIGNNLLKAEEFYSSNRKRKLKDSNVFIRE